MADIDVERKKSSPLTWILLVVVLLALVFLAWTFLRDDAPDATPAVQVDTASP